MKNNKKSFCLVVGMIIFLGIIFSFSTALAEVAIEPWDITGAGTIADYNLPAGTTGDIIETIATWLVGMIGFFGIIGFAGSGIIYLVSAGNDEMIKKAKAYMTYSLVGVIVAIAGFVVIQAVDLMLRASSF